MQLHVFIEHCNMKKIFTRNIIILAVVLFGFSLPGVVFAACPAPTSGKMLDCALVRDGSGTEESRTSKKCKEVSISTYKIELDEILSENFWGRNTTVYLKDTSGEYREVNRNYKISFVNAKGRGVRIGEKYTDPVGGTQERFTDHVLNCTTTNAPAAVDAEKEKYDQCIILVGKKHTQCTPVWNKKKEGIALSTDEETILLNCNQIHKSCMGPGGQEAFSQRGDISRDDFEKPEGYTGILPDCAFTYDGCRDINEVVLLGINIGKMIFSLIGTVAFVMFMYGGITMITSFGNAEKFKQGQGILVAAVVGIIISLGAYLLVDTILDALGVAKDFRVIG